MSYVPTIQDDVDFIILKLQQLKFLKLNQAHFLVLDVKDKLSRNCIFERSEIEVGEFHCTYPGDLYSKIQEVLQGDINNIQS